MAMKKSCFCVSNRREGTLIFLCIFMMSYAWGIMSYYLDFEDPVFKEFLNDNGFIYLVNIIIMMVGFSIFLATFVCILFNRPIILLLNSTIVFLPSKTISNIYTMFRFNAAFDNTFDIVFEKRAQNLSLPMRAEFRIELQNHYETQLIIVFCAFAIDLLIVIFAISVLQGYKNELKEKSIVPVSINFKEKKAKLIETLVEKFWFTAPQYSLIPTPTSTEYSSQANLSTISY